MYQVSYRYQMCEHRKIIIIYYCILIGVVTALFISSAGIINSGDIKVKVNFNGLDIATIIFLFMLSRYSFSGSFGMMLQNGVSRISLFKSSLLTILSLSFLMAVIDKLIYTAINLFASISGGSLWVSCLFDELYPSLQSTSPTMVIISFIFSFFLYMTFMAGGMFIAVWFYRIGKSAKIAICVGIPVILFIILPIVEINFTGGIITSAFWNMIDFMYGSSAVKPMHSFITGLLLFLLFSGISWLLLRKAVVQNN